MLPRSLGENANFPRTLRSAVTLREFVAAIPGHEAGDDFQEGLVRAREPMALGFHFLPCGFYQHAQTGRRIWQGSGDDWFVFTILESAGIDSESAPQFENAG